MKNNDAVKVAMCGLGQWGPNLLRNLRNNEGCQVVALCDQDESRRKEFEPLHADARFYASVEEVAADKEVAAAVVATPAGLHEQHVRLLLEAGKHVLVEKPLALTLHAARRLVDLANFHECILMAGHTFLFNPSVRRVKEEIDHGSLGHLDLILAQRLSLGQIRRDCNALWNLAPHDISILLYWLEEMPETVSAHGMVIHERHEQEDAAFCVLTFPGRTMASIQVSWRNPIKVRQMTLVGSERMLIYDDVNRATPLTLYDQAVEEVEKRDPQGSFERFQLQIRRGPRSTIPVEDKEPLAQEVGHFLDCIRTGIVPVSSGLEALRVVSVLEALNISLKRNGEPVEPERI